MKESETIQKQWNLINKQNNSQLRLIDQDDKLLQRIFKSIGENYQVSLDDNGNILIITGTYNQLIEAEIEISSRLNIIKTFLEKRSK